jgi:hypothetical protein
LELKVGRLDELREVHKTAEGTVKLAEENATLHNVAEANFQRDQQRERVMESLRAVLSDARKERDAVMLENLNLKRKRAGSTCPPPPQVKLLVRPQRTATQQQVAPSPSRIEPPLFLDAAL